MRKLIVIADRGRIRTVAFHEAGDDPEEKNHLVEDATALLEEKPESRSSVVTDQSGRFSQGSSAGSAGGMSYGEDHKLGAEMERRELERMAGRIAEAVSGAGTPPWVLVAPQQILPRLQEALPADCAARLVESMGANLTKEPVAKLEKRFVQG